jgi:hypothetical protein
LTVETISVPKPVDISAVESIDEEKKAKGGESERKR